MKPNHTFTFKRRESKCSFLVMTALLLSGIPVWTQAETFSDFEHAYIQKYEHAKNTPEWRYQSINQGAASDFMETTGRLKHSFDYPFKSLESKGFVTIAYSPDHQLKIYGFDISTGGTMREYLNYAQLQGAQDEDAIELDNFDDIQRIEQVRIANQTYYLLRGLSIADQCHGTFTLYALKIVGNSVEKANIFIEKDQASDRLEIEYRCEQFSTQWHRYNLGEHMIRISHDMKSIDLMELSEDGSLSKNYIRYEKTAQGYQKTGMVK